MQLYIDNTSVVQLIQLSLVPVFLLVALGQMLNVATGRLARIIDRSRWYQDQQQQGLIAQLTDAQHDELKAMRRRMRFANWCINFLTLAAVLICVTVFLLVLNGILPQPLDAFVLFLYLTTMASITGGLVCFFVEVSIASATLTIPTQ